LYISDGEGRGGGIVRVKRERLWRTEGREKRDCKKDRRIQRCSYIEDGESRGKYKRE
jgi:hypothetical protein